MVSWRGNFWFEGGDLVIVDGVFLIFGWQLTHMFHMIYL